MEQRDYLPLLGLALRGGMLAVGEDAAGDAAKAHRARLIVLAADASERTSRLARTMANEGHCLLLPLPSTREELGKAFGRSTVAVAAVLDLGLALAAVRRLSAQNPEQYAEAQRRLELKAKRKQERASSPPRERSKQPPAHSRETTAHSSSPSTPNNRGRTRTKDSEHRERRTRREGGSRPPDRGKGDRRSPYSHSRPVKKGKGSFRKKDAQ